MRIEIGMALCIGLLLAVNGMLGVCRGPMAQERYRSPFRYIIISNEGQGPHFKPGDSYRYVEVLLDEKAFTEDNLKELFRLLAKRFPRPRTLHVQVYTNLEDIETPEEKEMGKLSEAPFNPLLDRYRQATFSRDVDGEEWFTYNPSPPDGETKKVILKGPSANKRRK